MTTGKDCNLTDMLLPKPDVWQERELAGHSDNYPKLWILVLKVVFRTLAGHFSNWLGIPDWNWKYLWWFISAFPHLVKWQNVCRCCEDCQLVDTGIVSCDMNHYVGFSLYVNCRICRPLFISNEWRVIHFKNLLAALILFLHNTKLL